MRPLLLALIVAVAPAAAATDPLAWAGAGTRILAGAAVPRLASSSPAVSLLEENLQLLSAATGTDLLRQSDEAVLAISGSGPDEQWLWIVKGRFTPGAPLRRGIHALPETARSGLRADSFAFVQADLLVAGSPEAVQGAMASRAPAPESLLSAAARLRASRDVWLVSERPLSAGYRLPDRHLDGLFHGDLFQPVERVTAGVLWGTRLAVDIEAHTAAPADAEALVEVGTFLMQLMGAQAPAGGAAGLLAAVENRRLTASGTVARFTCEVSEVALANWTRRALSVRRVRGAAQVY
ncbi:MAG: hypothetical protein IPM24_09105 [Bryobacterales bacterium]|nr:hypothetical protein [Bryobacterales bacterium]